MSDQEITLTQNVNAAAAVVQNEAQGPHLDNLALLQKIIESPTEKLIPWEDLELPSAGIYYNWSSGVIRVRAFGANTERIMSNQRLVQSGQMMDELFRECCQFPDGFDPADLISGDQMFLFYALRGISHGNIYEFAAVCNSCQSTSTHAFDMNELAGTVRRANRSLGNEPFKINLLNMSRIIGQDVWITVRFPRARDISSIARTKRAVNKAVSGKVKATRRGSQPVQMPTARTVGDSFSDLLKRITVSVLGVSDPMYIEQFVEKIDGSDLSAVRAFIEDNMPDISTTVTLTCPECQHECVMALPITENFFRPAKLRRTGA